VFSWIGGFISWTSKLQHAVSSFTADSEYIAGVATTLEALWLRKLMADLGEPITPVPIAEDGQACLALIANPKGTGRTKHIDVCHHLVRERTEMGEVRFYYTPGVEVVAGACVAASRAMVVSRNDSVNANVIFKAGTAHFLHIRDTVIMQNTLCPGDPFAHVSGLLRVIVDHCFGHCAAAARIA